MPALLDLPALTAPIPGSDPAGGPTPLTLRQQLDAARKEVDPSRFAADDPMRPSEFQHADWDTIIRETSKALEKQSKDLLLAARLTEALTRKYGFAGLREGLSLLRTLVVDCWDRLAPRIDDPSDLDIRSAPFEWLDDADHGAFFPGTIRTIPIIDAGDTRWSYADWQRLQGNKDRSGYQAFEQATAAAPVEALTAAVESLMGTRDEVARLRAALDEKLADLAPGLSALEGAVIDCQQLAQQVLTKRSPAGAAPAAAALSDAATTPAVTSTIGAAPGLALSAEAGREEVYRLLAEATRRLEVLEPHSPIPYLLRRCLDLGRKPFAEMIESFVRDESVLKELRRELGIPQRQDEAS